MHHLFLKNVIVPFFQNRADVLKLLILKIAVASIAVTEFTHHLCHSRHLET